MGSDRTDLESKTYTDGVRDLAELVREIKGTNGQLVDYGSATGVASEVTTNIEILPTKSISTEAPSIIQETKNSTLMTSTLPPENTNTNQAVLISTPLSFAENSSGMGNLLVLKRVKAQKRHDGHHLKAA